MRSGNRVLLPCINWRNQNKPMIIKLVKIAINSKAQTYLDLYKLQTKAEDKKILREAIFYVSVTANT
jgi:hypothetical protein